MIYHMSTKTIFHRKNTNTLDSPMIDFSTDDAIQRVLRLMAIPGKSCQEKLVAEAIIGELRAAGVQEDQILFDGAGQRTPLPGEVGNLIVRIPGTCEGPTILLSAHMDTVPICVGSQPVLSGDIVKSADPNTGLGADDRSGVATVLTTALELLKSDRPHGPVVLCFFVQEEIGLQGARNLDPSLLGPIDLAVNFDGGTVEKLTVGATGGERMTITVHGRATHAGVAPEQGINASTIFALATADLFQAGWLGRIERDGGSGTSNIGVVSGGDATNVVLPLLRIRAEARSHDSQMRQRIVKAFRDAFENAVSKVATSAGDVGKIEFASQVDYDSFRLPDDSPCILAASKAIQWAGRTPYVEIAGGGLDANWLFRHGIHAVTLGCGQRNIHTVNEELILDDYLAACRIAIKIVLNAVA
jgi:tripeptide aminopeptidase